MERRIRLKVYKTLTFYILLIFKYCRYNNKKIPSDSSSLFEKSVLQLLNQLRVFIMTFSILIINILEEKITPQALVLLLVPSLIFSFGYIE